MVKIADLHTLRCPKCHADIASRAGGSNAAYYGLADEFACKTCGHHISLSLDERLTRDYVTSLGNRRRAFMLKFGGSLAVVVLVIVFLVIRLLGLPLIAFVPAAFFSLLVVIGITTFVTKSHVT